MKRQAVMPEFSITPNNSLPNISTLKTIEVLSDREKLRQAAEDELARIERYIDGLWYGWSHERSEATSERRKLRAYLGKLDD